MKKITVNGKERLWNGDPCFWSGTAPVLFLICGGLPDDKFTYKGLSQVRKNRGGSPEHFATVKKVENFLAFSAATH